MVAVRIKQDAYLRYKIIVLWWQTPSVQLPFTKIPGVQIEICTLDNDKLLKKMKKLCFVKKCYLISQFFPPFCSGLILHPKGCQPFSAKQSLVLEIIPLKLCRSSWAESSLFISLKSFVRWRMLVKQAASPPQSLRQQHMQQFDHDIKTMHSGLSGRRPC